MDIQHIMLTTSLSSVFISNKTLCESRKHVRRNLIFILIVSFSYLSQCITAQAKEQLKLKYCSYRDINASVIIDSSITEDKIECLGSTDGAGHEIIIFKKSGKEILAVNIESTAVTEDYRRLKINDQPGFGYSPDKGALNAATDDLKKIVEFEK